jgi:hypothetical protein
MKTTRAQLDRFADNHIIDVQEPDDWMYAMQEEGELAGLRFDYAHFAPKLDEEEVE